MARSVSRQEFLRLATLGGLGLAGALLRGGRGPGFPNFLPIPKRLDPKTGIELDKNDYKVSFGEAAQLALLAGKAGEILQIDHWRPQLTPETFRAWTEELVIQMQAEGIIDKIEIPELFFFAPEDGDEGNYTLGSSYCEKDARLSSRFVNPFAGWYDSPDWPGTIAHELVHALAQNESLCRKINRRDQLESTAQVAKIKILSAMAVRGNGFAFRALVWDLTDICLRAALALSINTQDLEKFRQLRSVIHPGILSQAYAEKLDRENEGNEYDRLQTLQRYGLVPLDMIMMAHLTNNDVVTGLELPPKFFYPQGENYVDHPHYEERTFDIRDWAWLMANLEDVAEAFARLPETSIVR